MKKNGIKFLWKSLRTRVWLLVTCITLVFIFTVSLVVTQNVFLKNTISTVFGGERQVLVSGDPSKYQYYEKKADFKCFETESKFENKAETLKQANLLNEQIAGEGFVLLKNENVGNTPALPLAETDKVSVFGKNSVNLVYGGSGSSGGGGAGVTTLYDSLDKVGIKYNGKLKEFYENKNKSGAGRSSNPAMGTIVSGIATGETPIDKYTSEVRSSYSEFNDAAIVVISRIGGEGFDLPRSMKTTYDANAKAVEGANAEDHYLELDNNEKAMLEEVCENFDRVILLVNCSTSFELGFLDDGTYDIDACLWIGSPGSTGINALGKVLKGELNPSGRLVDTFARDFTKDPTYANFSNNNQQDGNRYMVADKGANAYFVDYEESIYVGYRYYETRAYDEEMNYGNYEWYAENVVFPFGFGKSYSDFTWEITESIPEDGGNLEKDGSVSIDVKVTNNGDLAGKDVVELYYTAPYFDGEIEKAHVVLGDYAKTPIIQPGESKTVTLKMDVSAMASYDYNDANNNDFKGYELDAGRYTIALAKDAHHAWQGEALTLDYRVPRTDGAGFQYATDPVTNAPVVNRYDDTSFHIEKYLTRNPNVGFESTMPTTPSAEDRVVDNDFISSLAWVKDDSADKPWYVEKLPEKSSGSEKYQLYNAIERDENGNVFIDFENDEMWNNLLDQLTIEEMAYMIGTGNFNTHYLDSIGKPKTTDPDGPAGFTNFMGDPTVYGTCFYSSECLIGATWNKDLVYDMGVMIGIESLCGNEKGDGRPYSGWYAPAVNIHRSPFSGRNFDYYSEDPILSGMMAAQVISGAKSKGVYTYVKHFAVNDQETNRDSNGLITWLSEQALREIYLKPFELAVKEGGTTAIMSSFNRIGTTWTGGDYRLLTEILRAEWGFRGMVITDYNLCEHMPADQMIRAGGDLNLTQNDQPSVENASVTQIAMIRRATKNILYTVAGSNAMNNYGEGVVWRYAMPMWQVFVIVINVVFVAGFAVWGFFAIRKTLKEEHD